ncbi:unnamed protein product [Schistosoma mattheei]|uniref:DBC1/CARP1 catalytically inactive NUDIX hydrolase domain-containing protein n=1 Tax=Schistosoma mattheei TaxID=31246 RepID=A0AA85AWD9_9TREM|nr:unnamed protein product [Schistosoma mattheei]
MANRWGRNAPYGGAGGGGSGYMGSGVVGVGFYMGGPTPNDRRPYNAAPVAKPFYGGYREDNYNRRSDRRDDFRGGKRGQPKGRSPEKRYHDTPPSQRKDHRAFGKRQSSFSRYEVKIPKGLFNVSSSSLPDLRHRYPHLNISGDFYECTSLWVESFPMHEPFQLGSGTDYHVFHRDVDPPTPLDSALLNPPDADYSYSARVMLMACPQLGELYKNTCRMADDANGAGKVLPDKSIHFLVGGRAKSETMALGGPWSPSLDGPDPQGDPRTLIKTAIRTFKGLTGLDLSSCTEWVRFMELKYYRMPDTKAPAFTEAEEEREITSERPEVVVFFIPNAAHLIPSEEQWAKTKEYYNSILQKQLTVEKVEEDSMMEQQDGDTSVADVSVEEPEESSARSDMEPTHYSKLDVNTLKEIKAEQTPNKISSPSATQSKDDSKDLSEKDRRRLERLYRLGDKPAIVIHPNKSAKGGRFDCHRVSLFSLLDYHTEDQKEHNFEVSLFAEQFHEMLQRDAAFTIFKAIHDAPEKEIKPEQDGKLENGLDSDEPDSKRRRNDSQNGHCDEQDEIKVRRLRRTVNPALLFAFTYFDMSRAGYIREHDLCEILHLLGLRYSRTQMRKLVARVATRRDHVSYHNLTDSDIVEGDEKDVVSMNLSVKEDIEVTRMLALGNRALFDMTVPQTPARIVLGGGNTEQMLKRVELAEAVKQKLEFQFFQIKDELEKTRVKVNSFKDTEDELRAENRDLASRLKSEQKQLHEYKSQANTYNHLLRSARDQMDKALFDINKQFDKEKAKREAEKAAADAEKAKAEEEANKLKEKDDKVEDCEKSEEKEWEVVDAV